MDGSHILKILLSVLFSQLCSENLYKGFFFLFDPVKAGKKVGIPAIKPSFPIKTSKTVPLGVGKKVVNEHKRFFRLKSIQITKNI
jgi:hypothetical protein